MVIKNIKPSLTCPPTCPPKPRRRWKLKERRGKLRLINNFFLKKVIILIFVSTAVIPSQQTTALPSLKKIIYSMRDNFHTVEKGKFYRCKQLSAKNLAKYIDSYAIKTIEDTFLFSQGCFYVV